MYFPRVPLFYALQHKQEDIKMNYSLIVVGSGGTGSYFLKEFSRFYQGRDDFFSSMVIFDGDIVEDKNLMRQSFLQDDVGYNKAAVLADVLNDAFGLKWSAFGKYVTSKEDVLLAVKDGTVPVIIGCVDNHACRLVLEEVFHTADSCIYIDSANEFSSGEVVFSLKENGRIYGPLRSERCPEVKDEDLRSREEMSCEELNNAAPQHIATNMLAGNIILSAVCNLISGNYKPGMAVFNSADYSMEFYGSGVA